MTFETDTTKEEADYDSYDAIVLPGGMPGTLNLGADTTVTKTIREFAQRKTCCGNMCRSKRFRRKSYTRRKKATCHPGFEGKALRR